MELVGQSGERNGAGPTRSKEATGCGRDARAKSDWTVTAIFYIKKISPEVLIFSIEVMVVPKEYSVKQALELDQIQS